MSDEIEFKEIVGAGGGGGDKGGGSSGGGHVATEDPDSLQSRSMLSVLDLIGEGQIGGLVSGAKSIYFNDTQLMDDADNYNFSGVTWEQRVGTQSQEVISGFSAVETPHDVGLRVKHGIPITFTITNPEVDRVRCIVSFPSFISQDASTGDVHGTTVDYHFMVSVNNGAYQTIGETFTLSGKSRSKYQRSHVLTLPKTAGATSWTIKMERLSSDSTDGTVSNETWLAGYVEIVDARLNYPNSALVGITIDSSQFNQIPSRSYLVDGLYIQVPSNYDPVNHTYSGVWNGTFKVAVSDDPAWVLYDVLTSKRYGLGQYVAPSQVDKAKLYQISKYCNELVPDGYGGYEPRFTCNTTFQTRAEAYRLISDLTSIFRGMGFWDGSTVSFTQDSPLDPTQIYSPANVINGEFTYSGSSRKDRHSVAIVTWNDPAQKYKQVQEYVEDQELVARWGVRESSVVAVGCTSRGQAHRVGLWLLYSESSESDVVTFKVGLDSVLVSPGQIIRINDPFRAGKRMAGRVVSSTPTSVTVDSPVTLASNTGAVLSVRLPDGSFVDRTLTNVAGSHTVLTFSPALPSAPLTAAMWVVAEQNLEPMLARVVAISKGENSAEFVISAVEHNPSKYAAIEGGVSLQEQKTSLLDFTVVDPPSNLAVVETPVILAPGTMGLSLDVSWEGNAASYVVSWKRDGDYQTNWETTTTYVASLTVAEAKSGVYTFSVVSVDTLGRKSVALTGSATVTGDLPSRSVSTLTGVSASGGLYTTTITWSYPSGVEASMVEILYSATNNQSSAVPLTTVSSPAKKYTHPGLGIGQTCYYWLRLHDVYGGLSEYVAISATTTSSPAQLLEHLHGSISADQLTAGLREPIESVPRLIDESVVARGNAEKTALAALGNALDAHDLQRRLSAQETITDAIVSVDPATGQIQLLATANVTTDVEARVTAVETKADATAGTLTGTVTAMNQVRSDLTSAQSQIAQLANQITQTASEVYVDTAVENAAGAATRAMSQASNDLALAVLADAVDVFNGQKERRELSGSVAIAQQVLQAHSGALDAISQQTLTLAAAIGNAVSMIVAESQTRTTNEQTTANQITTLQSAVNNNASAIQIESQTRTTNEASTANQITTLQSAVNSNASAIQTESSTRASEIGGLLAKWSVKTQVVNGDQNAVSGIELNSGENGSLFAVLADKFVVYKPNGTGAAKQVFTLGTVNGQEALGLAGDMIVDGAITANSAIIANGAITNAKIGGEIKSDNFVSGDSGWRIAKDGSIEMSNGTFRGTVEASSGSITGNFSVGGKFGSNLVNHLYGRAYIGASYHGSYTYAYMPPTDWRVEAYSSPLQPGGLYVIAEFIPYIIAKMYHCYPGDGFNYVVCALEANTIYGWKTLVAWAHDRVAPGNDTIVRAITPQYKTLRTGPYGLNSPIQMSTSDPRVRVVAFLANALPSPLDTGWCAFLENNEGISLPSSYINNNVNTYAQAGATADWNNVWRLGAAFHATLIRVSSSPTGIGGWNWGETGVGN